MTPETLRAWREAHAMSRREAEEALGIPPRSFESLETGGVKSGLVWGLLGRFLPLLDHEHQPGP